MKNFFSVLLIGAALLVGNAFAHAQAGTLPSATATANTIPYSLPSNCTTTNPCQFQVYRCSGTCTTTSGTWTLIGTTAAQSTNYVDNTAVGGTLYSYDVEAVPSGSTTIFSGPSNVGTITTQFTPLPPTIGTITTS